MPGSEPSGEARAFRSERELLGHQGFDFLGSGVLHLGLLPMPFAGRLDRADIFILLLNPGFRPSDYFAEFRDEAFRKAWSDNIRQETPPRSLLACPENSDTPPSAPLMPLPVLTLLRLAASGF